MSAEVAPKLTDEVGWAVVRTVRSPLLVLDRELRVLTANPAFYATYELAVDEVEGELLFEIGDGQWDVAVLHETLLRVLPEDREIHDVEVRSHLEGVGARVMLVNAREIRSGSSGRQDLILLSLEDVTRREQLQEELRRTLRRLEKSNRDLEQFAHAASHDLQEPLRKIGTYAQRLQSILDGEPLGEKGERYLGRMDQAVARLRRRIDDMLRLSRVSRAELRMEEVDLEEVLDQVLEELEMEVASKEARIGIGDLPVVPGDRSLLHTVFQNLVANALKFHAEDEAPRIDIRPVPAPEDGTVRIVVEDHGIGFDGQYAERIFQPFERLHGTAEYEGSGVGLALCRRVMEHHGGAIHAEAREGGGARFVIDLPTRRASPEPPS